MGIGGCFREPGAGLGGDVFQLGEPRRLQEVYLGIPGPPWESTYSNWGGPPPSCVLLRDPGAAVGVDVFQLGEPPRHHVCYLGIPGPLWESAHSNWGSPHAIMCAT